MNGEAPARLGDCVYLLAYDPVKQRMTGRARRGTVVNAAVLVDLWLAGVLTDDGRRVALVPAARAARGYAGLEADVIRQIREGRPHRWKYWVRRGHRTAERAVRDRLATRRVLRVEERTLLWVVPRPRITVRDTHTVHELVARCRAAVLDHRVPVADVEAADAALVALVAAAEWNTVFTGKERRAHRHRIAEFAARSGPAAKALREVVRDEQASAAG
ncbi:GPP34 family phosphoprotein [Spongisporangium articulatum]|uniref:GPP34 family phosphoprotein n=1 Tax=Spongisporangium articulatum TaxID=3362603 RepID=A0ABW8AMG6_9ACTN